MKLWILRPVEDTGRRPFWYDCAHGFIIRAPSEERARALADANAGDENRYACANVWLDPAWTSCTLLPPEGPEEEIIMADFLAG